MAHRQVPKPARRPRMERGADMIEVQINGKQIHPWPPVDGEPLQDRYFTLDGDVVRFVDCDRKPQLVKKGEMVWIKRPPLSDAELKAREAKRYGAYNRPPPPSVIAGQRNKLERERRRAKADKQARKQARRRA